MRPIRIALTKGRLEQLTITMLEQLGYDCEQVKNKGRRLILPIGDGSIEVVLAKAPDVITYVENGVCDMGVVGKDTILEKEGNFYEVADLGFGTCKFALAVKKGTNFYEGYDRKVVASKYVHVAKQYFHKKNMDVDLVKIEGSVELAPILGLADGIVDIVETGNTLKENGLEVVETICEISARFIVNVASMKTRKEEIGDFIQKMERFLEEKKEGE